MGRVSAYGAAHAQPHIAHLPLLPLQVGAGVLTFLSPDFITPSNAYFAVYAALLGSFSLLAASWADAQLPAGVTVARTASAAEDGAAPAASTVTARPARSLYRATLTRRFLPLSLPQPEEPDLEPEIPTLSQVSKKKAALFGLLVSSCVVLIACSAYMTPYWVAQVGVIGEAAYALAVSGLTIIVVIVLLSPFDDKLPETARLVVAITLAVLWTAVVGAITFSQPFHNMGNGFFAAWVGLYCAFLYARDQKYPDPPAWMAPKKKGKRKTVKKSVASPKKSVAAPKTSTVEVALDGAAAALPPPDDEEGGGAGGEKKVTIADGEEGKPSADAADPEKNAEEGEGEEEEGEEEEGEEGKGNCIIA